MVSATPGPAFVLVVPRTALRGLASGAATIIWLEIGLYVWALLALYPQFLPDDQPLFATTAALGVLQVAVECCVYGVLALGVWRADSWFRRSAVRRRLEAVTGTVLVALGVRFALSDR